MIGIGSGGTLVPAVEQMVEDSRSVQPDTLGRREALTEAAVGSAFLVTAAAMAVALPWQRSFDLGAALLLCALYALVSRVRLEDGSGYTVPTQIIFVPMLFFLPAPLVPAVVAVGCIAGNLPDFVTRRKHPSRVLLSLGDSWHSVGPALVFAFVAAGAPDMGDWWLVAAALCAQFAFDFAASTAREWIGVGISPRGQLRLLAWVYLTDACLAPLGLFAAVLVAEDPWALLLLTPLAVLLAFYAAERRSRITNALELSRAYRGTALLLGELIESDDAYTGSHSRSVVEMSLLVADRMGVDSRVRREVELAALLHDVGKIRISDDIINKPGPLDDDEWAVMRTHTIVGQDMLDRVGGLLADVGRVVRASHERHDGRGYPDGLAGDAIPLAARIVSCCDAFSAMTTSRAYRLAMSSEVAVQELFRNAGTQFDPAIVRELVRIVGPRSSESGLPELSNPLRSHTHAAGV